jgi:hypothetical protein
MSHGGNLTVALWEVRAIVMVVPLVFLASGLLTERRHLYEIAAVLGLSLTVLAAQAMYEYFFHIRNGQYGGAIEAAFNHENAVLVSLLTVAGTAWALWGPDRKQRLIALGIAGLAFIVLLAMRRRAGLITAEAGVLTVGLVLLLTNWRRFMLIAPIIAVFTVLYLMAFWNHTGSFGQPARAFRSVFDSASLGSRDLSSDDYRLREKSNVWWTIQANRDFGIGFGVPYPKPLPLVDLSMAWPFWDYIPHNTILWIWMRAGILAFITLLALLASSAMEFTNLATRAKTPLVLAAATFAGSLVVMLTIFAYIDLGLANARLMVLFGGLLGTIPLLRRLVEEDERRQEAAPA